MFYVCLLKCLLHTDNRSLITVLIIAGACNPRGGAVFKEKDVQEVEEVKS